jgi:altronate hydrolase
MTMRRLVLLDARDSVAVAVDGLEAGEIGQLLGAGQGTGVPAGQDIPPGHKLALRDLAAGNAVIKYGLPIGRARQAIPAGAWVHSHNLESGLHGLDRYEAPAPFVWSGWSDARELLARAGIPSHFQGYRRADGSVGIRNEVWILPMVGCVNRTAEQVAELGRREFGLDAFAFGHPYGCSQLGGDLDTTRRILARLATHPNAAGALVLSLGCENNTLPEFKASLRDFDPARIRFVSLQEAEDEIEAAQEALAALAETIGAQERVPVPLAELTLGLKCGGSDGFSGITANPLVGRVCELLVAGGGSALMTEVPEMFGAETVLMARAGGPEVFEAEVRMVNDFKDYFIVHGQEVYENPSPGNRAGGITTLEEKSLGCIRKAGTVPVEDVLAYGERRRRSGLTLVSGPGNDQVSTTALTAAGAHMILFTTGRGTPFGAPAPTLKIASNTDLATRKPRWIDFDAGRVLSGTSFDELAIELLREILAVAEGQRTKAELGGYREIAIFKDGVTL